MSEKHDESNDEKFLRDLFERLIKQEKRSRLRIIVLTVGLLMSGIAFVGSLASRQRTNMPDEFLLLKLQQNVEQRNQPVRDSIDFYLSRMPDTEEKRKLRYLVNQLDTNTVISIEKFSGKRPFEPGE
jgi:hypothetical protein